MLRVLAVAACCAVAAVAARADAATQGSLVQGAVRSHALRGTLAYAVYLPAGYDRHPERRYPVLYVLHGLPGTSASYRSLGYLRPVLDRLQADAIVVFPQGAKDADRDDEYLDLGPGRNWETALAQELPAAIAQRFRVLTARTATGIVGISAGGYGAATLGLHHLARYSVVQSWSGYFHATSPDGSGPMSLPAAKAQYANLHDLVRSVAKALRRYPTQIGFYTGGGDPYPGFVAENARFHRQLLAANVPHRFAVYSGGHDSTLWLAHARDWLGRALAALDPPG